jgi:hypothetical protein
MTQMVWEKGLYRGQKGNLISTVRPSKNGFRKNVRYMKFLAFMKTLLVGGIIIVVTMTIFGI